MKKICILNKGENIKKLEFSFNNKFDNKTIYEGDLFFDRYVVIDNGSDDVVIVKNYNPFYIIKGDNLFEWNNLKYSTVAEYENIAIIQKPIGVKYVVKPLESLTDIANKMGVDEQFIIDTNKLKTNKLFVGQVLVI